MKSTVTRVVIVGGGFGGVKSALELGKRLEFEVTLISSQDHFAYYPQLYHAATGGSYKESWIALSEIFAETPSVTVVKDTITGLDPKAKTVTGEATYAYDELILALGSVTNYFGIKGLPEFSYGIKSIADVDRFKHHLHEELVDDKRPELNYVVIGAGPTGSELSGALGAYLRRILKHHPHTTDVFTLDLVEAAPTVLPRSHPQTSAKVFKRLQKLGVKIMTGATVQAESADMLTLAGQSIASRTVVWTAGVANNAFFAANAKAFKLAKNGRVEVNEFMQAADHIYVIGDNAATANGGLALTAINDAKFVARHLARQAHGQALQPYRQPKAISVIPIGEYWAAVEWGNFRLYGYAGWILRRLGDLVGYLDVLPLSKALIIWSSDRRHQDDCPICQPGTTPTKI